MPINWFFILDRKLVFKLLLDILRIVRTLPRTEETILVSKEITNKASRWIMSNFLDNVPSGRTPAYKTMHRSGHRAVQKQCL